MATTGFNLGANAANVVGTWTNLTNALAENDNVSTFTTTTKNDDRTLRVYNLGFDSEIPDGATIDAVNLKVRSSRSTGGTTTVWLRRSTTDGTVNTPANTSLATNDYASQARPGGGNWAKADLVNGVLEVRFRGLQPNNTTSRSYNLAWVEVEVVYTSTVAHEQPVDDTLSLADGVVKAPQKNVADTLSLADGQTKDVSSVRADSVTITESVVKRIDLSKADEVTVSDDLESLLYTLFEELIEDSLSLSDAVSKEAGVNKADSVAPSDTLAKDVQAVRTDSVAPSDQISNQPDKALGDTLSLADVISKQPNIIRNESLDLSDEIANSVGINLTDSANVADVVVKGIQLTKAENLAIADALAKDAAIFVIDTVTPADAINPVLTPGEGDPQNWELNIDDSLNVADSFGKAPRKSVADSVTPSDAQVKAVAIFKTDSISASDAIDFQKQIFRTIADNLSLSDSKRLQLEKTLTDTLTVSDSVSSRVITLRPLTLLTVTATAPVDPEVTLQSGENVVEARHSRPAPIVLRRKRYIVILERK